MALELGLEDDGVALLGDEIVAFFLCFVMSRGEGVRL